MGAVKAWTAVEFGPPSSHLDATPQPTPWVWFVRPRPPSGLCAWLSSDTPPTIALGPPVSVSSGCGVWPVTPTVSVPAKVCGVTTPPPVVFGVKLNTSTPWPVSPTLPPPRAVDEADAPPAPVDPPTKVWLEPTSFGRSARKLRILPRPWVADPADVVEPELEPVLTVSVVVPNRVGVSMVGVPLVEPVAPVVVVESEPKKPPPGPVGPVGPM